MRSLGFTLALLWAASAQAAGELCTELFPSGTNVSVLSLTVSTAAPGSVLCLTRGGTYTGTNGLVFENSLASASLPVLVCSATGNQCSSDGGANARLVISGDAVTFGAGAQFLTLRDIDLVGSGGDSAGVVFAHGDGTAPTNITIEGGSCSGFGTCLLADPIVNATPATSVRVGSCATPWLVRDTTDPRGAIYGFWRSATFAVDVARSSGPNLHLDTGAFEDSVSGVVVECSRFSDADILDTTGALVRVSGHVTDLTIQRSVISDTDCDNFALGVTSTGVGLTSEFATLRVSENIFRTSCAWDVFCGFCQNSTFFNNVFRRQPSIDARGAIVFTDASEISGSFGGNAVFNNTFVDLNGSAWSDALVRFDSGQGTTNAVFNNLFHLTGTNVRLVDGCAQLGGSSGVSFDNNFLFAPDDATPDAAGCAGGGNNSTAFNVDPGLVDVDAGDFTITTTSAVAGLGTSAGAPVLDFAGNTRPSPPSIGAFDVQGACVGDDCEEEPGDGGTGSGNGLGGGGESAGDISSGGCAAGADVAWSLLLGLVGLRGFRRRRDALS